MPKNGKEPDLESTTMTDGEQTEAPPKKSKMNLLIYIVVSVVMVGAGIFGGTKFLGKTGPDDETAKHEQNEEEKEAEPINTEMVLIDDIIVNPSGTGGTRFLSCSIGFEISIGEMAENFDKRKPMIRDALITILGSKTLEQLSDAREKEITRYQIKKRVEQLLKVEELYGVYFTDFVLQ